jgi:hypothetical protein
MKGRKFSKMLRQIPPSHASMRFAKCQHGEAVFFQVSLLSTLVETCLLSCSKSLWSLGAFSLSPLFSKTTQFDIVIVGL